MRFVLSMLVFVLALAAAAWAADEEAPRCDNCGMFFEKSAARVSATIEFEDQTYNHLFECLGCLHDYIHENYGEVKPSELMVLDYATFGTDDEQMIDGFEATYLFGTERLAGSMPPYVAAFSDEDAAAAAQEELGGELVDFAGMKKLMIEAKGGEADSEMDMHDGEMHGHEMGGGEEAVTYVCPCTGGCCADIESDEPGECPNCGMALIKKES